MRADELFYGSFLCNAPCFCSRQVRRNTADAVGFAEACVRKQKVSSGTEGRQVIPPAGIAGVEHAPAAMLNGESISGHGMRHAMQRDGDVPDARAVYRAQPLCHTHPSR